MDKHCFGYFGRFVTRNLVTAQQISTVKLPRLFQRFQTKQPVLKVNKSKITAANTFNGDTFETECNSESNNQIKMEKQFFEYFGRFVTRGLTL